MERWRSQQRKSLTQKMKESGEMWEGSGDERFHQCHWRGSDAEGARTNSGETEKLSGSRWLDKERRFFTNGLRLLPERRIWSHFHYANTVISLISILLCSACCFIMFYSSGSRWHCMKWHKEWNNLISARQTKQFHHSRTFQSVTHSF